MTPEEFIRNNLAAELEKMKVPYAQIAALADDGVNYWRQRSGFNKGAWQDTLTYVKKRIEK